MTVLAFSGKTNILDLYRMIECGPNDRFLDLDRDKLRPPGLLILQFVLLSMSERLKYGKKW
jgi:hypothetical protein